MQDRLRFLLIVLLIISALGFGCGLISCSGLWLYGYLSSREGGTPFPMKPPLLPFTPRAAPAKGGTLRIAGDEPVTLDPALVEDVYSAEYVTKIFSGLVTLDKDLEVIPDLAEKWEVDESGTVYTFYLRKDAVFHDGKPITAQDVKFSLERACDPALNSPVAGTYLDDIVGAVDKLEGRASEIKGVEVLDDYTLRITIDHPKVYFLSKLTYPVAFVVDREAVKAGKDWWKKNPNGTGPFVLEEYDEKGGRIVLRAFDDFYRGKPTIEKVEFFFGEGDPFAMYESGELDVTQVGVSHIEQVKDPANPLSAELRVVPSLDVLYIGLNVEKPPFDDVKVRRAFAYAINRKPIVNVIFAKMAREARGIVPPGMPGYDESPVVIPYDPDKARELLEESSYGGAENLPPITLSAGGAPLAEALANMLGDELGVEIEVEVLEWRDLLKEVNAHNLQMFILGWAADYPDPHNFLDIHFHSGSYSNNTGYANPKVDKLLEEARLESDPVRRMKIYHRAEQMIVEGAPWIPLIHGVDYVLVKPYVKGLKRLPTGTYHLEETYIEPRR